jgi:hypothetical protein
VAVARRHRSGDEFARPQAFAAPPRRTAQFSEITAQFSPTSAAFLRPFPMAGTAARVASRPLTALRFQSRGDDMKIRLITGAIGVALCVSTLPAEARRPASEFDHSGAYGGGARVLDFDHYQFWSSRQHPGRGSDEVGEAARRETAPRRRSQARAARPAPQASGPKAVVAPRPAVAARAVTSVARQASRARGARGCLTSQARALLERIESQFGSMQIVSTCRPGARIAGTGRISRHASGNAIDFNAGHRKGEVVRWLIANHKTGGVMTYAGMSHIHVDIGYPFVALNAGGRHR